MLCKSFSRKAANTLTLTALAAFFALQALAGPRRYARVGESAGAPEAQVHAADAWRLAIRNLPLIEGSRVRTDSQDRLEVELDDGAFVRLTGDTLAELSDYSQLSTGQHVTMVALDHGVVYFTGEPQLHDTTSLAAPGMQITLRAGSRVRVEAADQSSAVAVIEGVVRFTTPNAELDLHAGQYARVNSDAPGRFTLLREIPHLESDKWSEARDKATAQSSAATYVPGVSYGLTDLDKSGAWVQTDAAGPVWKPTTEGSWRPFANGHWEWYDEAGYTWVSSDSWGWLPYHYGRWIQDSSLGWVWSPDHRPEPIYKPGDVYWLRGQNRLAWGPLAPGEAWPGTARSQLYAAANTTIANFTLGQREIDPSSLDPQLAAKPAELLSGMAFTVAPLSPALAADRFEATRPELRSVEQRAPLVTVAPEVPEDTFHPAPPEPPPMQAAPVTTAQVMVDPGAVPPAPDSDGPIETYYPAAVYTGIVVVDPPLRTSGSTAGASSPVHSSPSSGSETKIPVIHEHPPERVPLPEPPAHPVKTANDAATSK